MCSGSQLWWKGSECGRRGPDGEGSQGDPHLEVIVKSADIPALGEQVGEEKWADLTRSTELDRRSLLGNCSTRRGDGPLSPMPTSEKADQGLVSRCLSELV